MRPEASVLLVALGLALGCSDDAHRLGGLSDDVSGSAARRAGLCKSGADLEYIDRMEDGDGTIDMVEQRGGVWFAFNDKSADSQFPSIDAETFSMSELTPARAGSHRAARSHGGGFTVWGAGIGFELYNQKAYDLSRYAGITFWARRAPGTASALRFAVTDSATAPRGGKCQDFVDYSTCSDYFGVDLSLSTAFRRYSFTWKELSQEGWGEPHPDSLATSEVYGVRFQADPIEDFDFWIDDIALLCHPE